MGYLIKSSEIKEGQFIRQQQMLIESELNAEYYMVMQKQFEVTSSHRIVLENIITVQLLIRFTNSVSEQLE